MSVTIFDSLLRQLPGGVLILNNGSKISYVNHFICQYSQLTEKALLGKSFFSCFPEVPRDWFNRKIEAVLTQKKAETISWQQRLYLLKFPQEQKAASHSSYMAQTCTLLPLVHPTSGEAYIAIWLQDVSEQASYHAELLVSQQLLKVHERQDQLTGLMNRDFWQRQLQLEMARAERYERPLSLLLFNVDRFKHLNEHYGQQQGDSVLQEIARQAASLLRDNDLLARFAGAEFALVLPDTPLTGAIEVANRLRTKLFAQALLEQQPAVRISISVGVCLFQSGNSVDELIHQSEQALYQAKRAGRNQVSIFTTCPIE